MTDKTLKILLGIIAVNLTIQTVKDVGLFPTAYAQQNVNRIEICGSEPFEASPDDSNNTFRTEFNFACVQVTPEGSLRVTNEPPVIPAIYADF